MNGEYFAEWPIHMAQFDKVSLDQFQKDWAKCLGTLPEENAIKTAYDLITLPNRAKKGDAGYDFVSPVTFALDPGDSIVIPTGICVEMDEGWFLACVPKSGLGITYVYRMAHTIGIIDQGYYYSTNEGHILMPLRNEGDKMMKIAQGDKLFQGIFLIHGITRNDNATGTRDGGFGSTGR